MTIYYVYVKWSRETDPFSAEGGRCLLTCSSRYVADEFYRHLETAHRGDGRKWFTMLSRHASQFWSFDSIDNEPWCTITDVLRSQPHFRTRIMSQILHDAKSGDSRTWPVIPVASGPDWINNRTYFIRNKRRPELYWYHDEGYVHVSSSQMTKFRVRGVDIRKDDQKVLTRSDRVEISLLDSSATLYVGKEPGSNRTIISDDQREWKFSALMGGFKVTWERVRDEGFHGVVVCANGDDGDDWELC